MKTAICRTLNAPLTIEAATLPKPRAFEIHIKVMACAICHSDIAYIKGSWGFAPPFIAGHEVAGIVLDVGAGAQGVKIGDRVIATLIKSCGACQQCQQGLEAVCTNPPYPEGGFVTLTSGEQIPTKLNTGGFAEEAIVHARQCVPLPQNMPFDIASIIGCGVITGFGAAMRVGKITAGEAVGVIGVGGVGINALQAARIAGANPILAIDTASSKEGLFRAVGASHYLNPSDGDIITEIATATDGAMLDIALIGVGSAQAIIDAIDMIKPGGRVVIMGMPASDDLAQIDATKLTDYAKTVIGTKMGSAVIREDIPRLIELYQAGAIRLDMLISHRYPFSDINTAIATATTPGAARVVLMMEG